MKKPQVSGNFENYICLGKNASFANGDFKLESIQPKNIEPVRQWRNAQMDILRQKQTITAFQQIEYFEKNIWPEKQNPEPKQILFLYTKSDVAIGYGALVHIDWTHRRSEVSFLLDPQFERNFEVRTNYFSNYLSLIKIVAFNHLHLNRLHSETYATRTLHINTLEASGFKPEGRLRQHIVINGKFEDALLHGCLKSEVA